jgi:hypothetical protein
MGCASITKITGCQLDSINSSLPASVFESCTNLQEVELIKGTTTSFIAINQFAFNNCTSLTTIDLGDISTIVLSSIDSGAFSNCPDDGEVLANTSGLAQSFIDAVHSASPQDKT